MDECDMRADAGENQAIFKSRISAADDAYLTSCESLMVARRRVAHAAPGKFRFAWNAELPFVRAGRDDHRAAAQLLAVANQSSVTQIYFFNHTAGAPFQF